MSNLDTQALVMSPAPPSIGTLRFMVVYATGQPIYVQGDPAHSLYAILAGAVRTVRHSRDGRRQIDVVSYP